MDSTIDVETKKFSGPLDLLLSLVEKEKIDIREIDIATITQSYIESLRSIAVTADEMTDFIYLASTLLLIKSNSLLPVEEEEEIFSKEEFIRRLLEYKLYKGASTELAKLEQRGALLFRKVREEVETKISYEELSDDPKNLCKAFVLVMAKKQDSTDEGGIDERILRVEEYPIEKILIKVFDRIRTAKGIGYSSFLKSKIEKKEKIAVFLSLLELMKQRRIKLYRTEEDLFFFASEED